MKYKLIIFDLDGTILDTLDDLTDAVNYSLKENQLPLRTKDEVRSFVGNGIRKLIERSVPQDTSVVLTDKAFSCFKEYYSIHNCDKTCPYEGITKLLESLRADGIITAVVSNKADNAVKKLIDRYFCSKFDFYIGERDGIPRKPAPDSLLEIINNTGADFSETLYIGDSEVDYETSANTGIDCILVDWGFRSREFLEKSGAKSIVSTISSLKAEIYSK